MEYSITRTQWYQVLNKYEDIMIFGAKENAKVCKDFVEAWGRNIKCFVVSKMDDNPLQISGIPVLEFNEIDLVQKEYGLIIISQVYEKNDEMDHILRKEGFRNILSGANQITSQVNDDILQEFKQRGKSKYIWELNNDFPKCENEISLCIYSATSHLNTWKIKSAILVNDYMKYIQAGAALTDKKICEIRDDVGMNVSKRNPYYCELTAGYWIAKNDLVHQYVGLCHYSRCLNIDNKNMRKIIANNIDVVLPIPLLSRVEMFVRTGDINGLMEKAIMRVSPDYKEAMVKYYSGKLFHAGNLVIARRPVFAEYYEWLFAVLCEIEKIMKENHRVPGKRELGYYGEHLTNIFFLKHDEYRIVYAPVYAPS